MSVFHKHVSGTASRIALSTALLSLTLCLQSYQYTWAQSFQLAQGAPSNPVLPGALIEDRIDPYTGKPQGLTPDATTTDEIKHPEENDSKVEDETPPQPKLDPSLTRKFMVTDIKVEGVTKLDDRDVEELVAQFEGKESSFIELQEGIADKLTQLYEDEGYITTLVFIPPQTIDGGVITVKADEGKISDIRYEGLRYFNRHLAVRPRLDLWEGTVFDVKNLKRSLRRINENPDLTLQATLKAGDNPGETIVVLSPKKQIFPWHFAPFVDNLGRDPIGKYRYGATLSSNNALGFGDSAYVSSFWTRRSWGILDGWDMPVGPWGTRIGFNHAHTQFKFDEADFEFKGRSNFYIPSLSQELYRNDHAVLSFDIGLAIKNSTFLLDGQGVNQDRLRVLTPAINFRNYDRWGQTFFRNEFGIGIPIWDATTNGSASSSRPGGGSQFFRVNTSLVRMQKLPLHTYGLLKVNSQFSGDKLVSLEQFQLGGASTVRGYTEGRLIGDSGMVISLEHRIPFFFIPKDWGVKSYKFRENLEFVSFMDYGFVHDKKPFSGVNPVTGIVNSTAIALGTGIGVRARITRFLNGRIDLGFPLLRQYPSESHARLHFGVESRFF